MKNHIYIIIVALILLSGCRNVPKELVMLPDIDISNSPNGVVLLPENVPDVVRTTFMKYTKYNAPNGKPIHFLAQDAWTDDQIMHARNVLEHILTSYPGSAYGNDKTAIANSMSEKRATMVLFNNTDELEKAFKSGLESLDHSMQDLRSNESPAVGDDDYMGHITRDASYEEIWHLVHDYGVVPTLPKMIEEMRIANDTAAGKGWRAWPQDEPQEHPNEYIGVLIDNYYDLWVIEPKLYEARDYEPGPEGTTHFGSYFANGREKLKKEDSLGFALIEKFFPPYLKYTPQLPVDFEGDFSMKLDESKPYTFKTQHLANVTARGSNEVNLVGNGHDNELTGNSGNNVLTGSAGEDQIDGGEGEDTAVFSGDSEEYKVSTEGDVTIVSDQVAERDGIDKLRNVEFTQFGDQKIRVD
jgi:hypothetical protein